MSAVFAFITENTENRNTISLARRSLEEKSHDVSSPVLGKNSKVTCRFQIRSLFRLLPKRPHSWMSVAAAVAVL